MALRMRPVFILAVWLANAFWVTYGIADWFSSEGDARIAVITTRFILGIILWFSGGVITWYEPYVVYHQEIAATYLATLLGGLLTFATWMGVFGPGPTVGVIALICGPVVARLKFFYLCCILGGFMPYLTLMSWYYLSPGLMAATNLIFYVASVIALTVGYVGEKRARNNFIIRRQILEQRDAMAGEEAKSDALIHNIFPHKLAERLKETKSIQSLAMSERYDNATVLFAGISGLDRDTGNNLRAQDVVHQLNQVVCAFDLLCEEEGVEKIKTIGPTFMAVCGLPDECDDHAVRAGRVALGMLRIIPEINERTGLGLEVRVGINSGLCVAGVIGTHQMTFDVWGDTVNVASRMMSTSEFGQIQISQTTHAHLTACNEFHLRSRGEVYVKGKGFVQAYLLSAGKFTGLDTSRSVYNSGSYNLAVASTGANASTVTLGEGKHNDGDIDSKQSSRENSTRSLLRAHPRASQIQALGRHSRSAAALLPGVNEDEADAHSDIEIVTLEDPPPRPPVYRQESLSLLDLATLQSQRKLNSSSGNLSLSSASSRQTAASRTSGAVIIMNDNTRVSELPDLVQSGERLINRRTQGSQGSQTLANPSSNCVGRGSSLNTISSASDVSGSGEAIINSLELYDHLGRWSLRFRDQEAEKTYNRYKYKKHIKLVRFYALFGALLWAAFALADVFAFESESAFALEILSIRLGALLVLALFLCVTYHPKFYVYGDVITALAYTYGPLTSSIAYIMDWDYNIVGQRLVTLMVFTYTVPLVKHMQLSCVCITGTVAWILTASIFSDETPSDILEVSLDLLTANVFGYMSAYLLNGMARHDYLLLRHFVIESKRTQEQRTMNEALLYNIFPRRIARKLIEHPTQNIAERFPHASILFCDIVGFTKMASEMSPGRVVLLLNTLFSGFDKAAEKYRMAKIKTIGDAYMAVGFPLGFVDPLRGMAEMALAMLEHVAVVRAQGFPDIQIRLGVNTGPVLGGVVGIKKFVYDVFGPDVDLAVMMETKGQPGRIHVDHKLYKELCKEYEFETRSEHVDFESFGRLQTYFLQGRKPGVGEPTYLTRTTMSMHDLTDLKLLDDMPVLPL
eukprot:TRINITY_DN12092_c0_g1_i2.p1 TRINITY_DN12092_c0_g1~~TRINITY_DN12092_c0_g1_i2.p1  ORF type:complete len:1084 (-),score=185.19 TRINITY_DN12092_c0_g1_i2:8-3259(-)